jgi:hypothetical protein
MGKKITVEVPFGWFLLLKQTSKFIGVSKKLSATVCTAEK